MSESNDLQESTGMVTFTHPIQTSGAILVPIIDPTVEPGVPGHRVNQGHYVAPAGTEVQLPTEQDFTIGRKRQSSNLYLEYPDVSRAHAIIRYDQGEGVFTITDVDSTNGTFLNEKQLTSYRAQMLFSGDQIRFGQCGIYLFLVSEQTP